MATIDYQTRQIQCKVIWYGIGGSGKTASLDHIYERTKEPGAQKLRPGADDPNTAYYDYLPLTLGEIRGYKSRFHLFSVPGADGYAAARLKLLENVDGIVFCADSRPSRQAQNLACIAELRHHLALWKYNLFALPFVLQCTFSDAPDAMDPARVAAPLLTGFPDASQVPVFASVPPQGIGVFEATKAVAKLVLTELKKG